MNLRQQADARPLLQMPAQGRAADLISGRFQTAPRRALSEKLTQGRQHPNRRRSGMAATLLRRGRAEIDNCRDEVQKPKIQHLLPCLTPQTWSFQTDNAPHQGCITAIPSNPSARDPTTHGISGNCLLWLQQFSLSSSLNILIFDRVYSTFKYHMLRMEVYYVIIVNATNP